MSRLDQAYVFRNRIMCFVREHKAPPHKLAAEFLRAGLRPMNVFEEVVQPVNIPQESEKLNYNADRLVASALTQTYEYKDAARLLMPDLCLFSWTFSCGGSSIVLWPTLDLKQVSHAEDDDVIKSAARPGHRDS